MANKTFIKSLKYDLETSYMCIMVPKIILDNFFYSIGLFYYGNRCIFYTIDDFINVSKVVVPHVALFGILLL